MRDAVDDHRVARGRIEPHGAGFNELGRDAGRMQSVDPLHQCAGKTVFRTEQDADLFHATASVPRGGTPRTRTGTVYDSARRRGSGN